MQAQASSQAELRAVQAELQGATEMLDTMQQMASSSMEGQEEAQKQMDALTAQLQAAIQVGPFWGHSGVTVGSSWSKATAKNPRGHLPSLFARGYRYCYANETAAACC